MGGNLRNLQLTNQYVEGKYLGKTVPSSGVQFSDLCPLWATGEVAWPGLSPSGKEA